jgi:voltage-gated potassium channel
MIVSEVPAGQAQDDEEALHRFERFTALPMIVLSVLFVPILIVPEVVELGGTWKAGLSAASWLIWGVFAAELTVRTYLAPRRLRFLARNWFDVAIVVLPFARPLRLLRSTRLLRLIVALRAFSAVARAVATTRSVLERRGLQYLLLVSLLVLMVGGIAVTHFERQGPGTIHDVPTGLWWAVTTMTTVGYGDTFPVSPEGRAIGVLLMLLGIGLFGVVTANIAAFFLEEQGESAIDPDPLVAIEQRLSRIEGLLAALTASRQDEDNPKP